MINEKIVIPKNSIKYILFQRTGYLKDNFLFNILSRIGNFKLFYKLSVFFKVFIFSSKIKSEFTQDMIDEYLIIKPFLPEHIDSILDIGCGVAAIDVLISNYYENNIDIFLIDKTSIDKNIYYKFEKNGSFYNSLGVSKKILKINGVNSDRIHLQEADKNEILFDNKMDIIISLISWGFHYPVSTYLDVAYEKLKQGGILIIDLRKGTSGEKEIKDKFGNYKIIFESKKVIRVLAYKSKISEI